MSERDSRIDPDLRKKIEAERWFHSIDFGEFSVSSYLPTYGFPPNRHLFSAFRYLSEISLEGQRCLDIGTFDGLTAFVLDRKGAARVDGTCQYDLPRFRLAREVLGADRVFYHPKTQLEDLMDLFGEAQFDLIVVSATLHQLTLPQECLFICRRLLKRNGLFILEAATFKDPTPALYLNPELDHPVVGNPTVWIPTDSAMKGMLRLASFDPLSCTDVVVGTSGTRIRSRTTILSKAVAPRDVRGRTKGLADIHDKAQFTGRIDYRSLARPDLPESSIRYSGPTGLRPAHAQDEVPDVPLQPRWNPPSTAKGASAESASAD